MTEQQAWRLIVRTTILVIFVVVLAWFAWAVRGVLVQVLVAIILAAGLTPALDLITGVNPPRRRWRLSRPLSLLLIYLSLFVLFDLFVALIVPPLIAELEGLATSAPTYVGDARDTLNVWSGEYPFLAGMDQRISDALQQSAASLGSISSQVSQILRLALGVADALLTSFLVVVMTFYLVMDGGSLRRGVIRLLPAENRAVADAVMNRARDKVGGWLIGQLLLSVIIGAVTFVGLLVLGIPYALLLAVVAAIGELIPMLGPIFSAVPAVVIATFKSPLLGLLTVALYILIQQLENHIVVPQVMRRAIDLPPLLVIVALLMGGEVLGIVGAILALPVAASLSVLYAEVLAARDRNEARRKAEAESTPAGGG
ncbi:MAG: AI-2E family transporter [Chloroflexota bacterium]